MHMYLLKILKFLLEERSCYVAQATWDLRFSSASWEHALPHLALKLILISIIWRRMALFSRLGSRGARPTIDIQNWRRNSNFDSTELGHSGDAYKSEVKQKHSTAMLQPQPLTLILWKGSWAKQAISYRSGHFRRCGSRSWNMQQLLYSTQNWTERGWIGFSQHRNSQVGKKKEAADAS